MEDMKSQQGGLMARFKNEYRLYLVIFILVIISELIGTYKFKLGAGEVVIFPMLFALFFGVLLGPDLLGIIKKKSSKTASSLVLIAIAPFMAKLGILAGQSLPKLAAVGPAMALQELGHVGTILFALPVALILGLKREAIGATSSTCREKDYGLITNLFGSDSPESRGCLSIYTVGAIIGAPYLGFLASLIASTGLFHPLALGMACGVGSSSMMAAASSVLANIYPENAHEILAVAGASDALAAMIGVYIVLFVTLPITKKLYNVLEPRLGLVSRKLSLSKNSKKEKSTKAGV